jgi:hypothetical protein
MANQRYKVRAGRTFGAFSQYQSGDIVELDEKAAVPFLDKLEPVEGEGTAPAKLPARELVINPATPLPEGFPHKERLEAAGFDTLEAVRGATDKQLTDLPVIGKKAVQDIREALN